MKKIITVFIFCFLFGECFSQAGEWVWIKGDSVPNQAGSYGVQGVPGPTNNPPSLYEPCEWTDLNGNFWLFGGVSIINTNYTYGDLWKYDAVLNEWTWMKGSGIASDTGSYGIQGVASPANNPPSRGWGILSWVDLQGNLWLTGGCSGGPYNDLWKYDISANEWTWMKGPNYYYDAGHYGTQGVPDSLNNPPSRDEVATAWTSDSGDLWLFGGYRQWSGQDMNDMWRYTIATNQWTWMAGSDTLNQSGSHTAFGTEAASNHPRARWSYCHWKDSTGKFWLFGGVVGNNGGAFGDLWRFNTATNYWAWFGSNYSYGTACVAASTNGPGPRFENRSAWIDKSKDFWVFGGDLSASSPAFKNDLWKFCIATKKWIWVEGNNLQNTPGIWGSMGVSSPSNTPGSRGGSIGWTDNNNHLYLFGGMNHPGTYERYNDVWKYTIDSACGVCPTSTGIPENNLTNELLVFPNPTNSSLNISFSSSEKQIVELRIYNTLGKEVYFSKEEILKGEFEKEINVEKLSDGIYFLQVKMKEGVVSKKVIKAGGL